MPLLKIINIKNISDLMSLFIVFSSSDIIIVYFYNLPGDQIVTTDQVRAKMQEVDNYNGLNNFIKVHMLIRPMSFVYRGTHIFLIFSQKHRLWVLVRCLGEAVLTCTHKLCVEQK